MHHTVRDMLKKAYHIGSEMIEAGGNGYEFHVTLHSGRVITAAFEHLSDHCEYIESMNPDKPALIHFSAIAVVEVEEV
jgi:hypothetical protein